MKWHSDRDLPIAVVSVAWVVAVVAESLTVAVDDWASAFDVSSAVATKVNLLSSWLALMRLRLSCRFSDS